MFSKGDANAFSKSLVSQLENVEDNVVEQLEEANQLVIQTSQYLIPEDTLTAKNSIFDEIERGDGYIKAVVGYDKAGEIDYITTIHWNVFGQLWNKDTAEDEFLTKGYAQNWNTISNTILKVDYE